MVTITVSGNLEQKLLREAQQCGLDVNDYAMRLLSLTSSPSVKVTNGKELVTYWRKHGLIGCRTDIDDSLAHARSLRQRAQRRQGG